jgi:hypothetical protein
MLSGIFLSGADENRNPNRVKTSGFHNIIYNLKELENEYLYW